MVTRDILAQIHTLLFRLATLVDAMIDTQEEIARQ